MRQRAPIVLSSVAIVVAVLGTTPIGQAAGERLAAAIPPFAKTAGFAKVAGNAAKLNGRRSTLSGAPGTIPVVGKNGKLPPAIGGVGPQGPSGLQGRIGPPGPAGPAGGGSGGGSPSGPAGGALVGTYPNPQIAPNAVGAGQVIDDSLTGADVNESTLGPVPSASSALLGGFGRSGSKHLVGSNTGLCTPAATNEFGACVDVTLALPARTRVLLLGRITANPLRKSNELATCRLGVNGAGVPGTSVLFQADLDQDYETQGTLIGVTAPLGPGPVNFTIDCRQGLEGIKSFSFRDAAIAAVAISPN